MSAAESLPRPLDGMQTRTLDELFGALRLYDPPTASHSAWVAQYARAIAATIGLPREERKLVYVAGLMHDVGKLFLPDRILKGTEKLDEADWALVRRHPEQGAWLVAEVSRPGPLAEVVLDHHERIDGGGYPNGLAGEEISIHARIISVADTVDAMTSRNSYRTPVSHPEAFEELRRVAGSQLDPELVEAMVDVARRSGPELPGA